MFPVVIPAGKLAVATNGPLVDCSTVDRLINYDPREKRRQGHFGLVRCQWKDLVLSLESCGTVLCTRLSHFTSWNLEVPQYTVSRIGVTGSPIGRSVEASS